MFGDIWSSSELTAQKLEITEIKLSFLRENGILKPGFIGKALLSVEKTLESQSTLQFKNVQKLLINFVLKKPIILQLKKYFLKFEMYVKSIRLDSHPYIRLEYFAKSDIS